MNKLKSIHLVFATFALALLSTVFCLAFLLTASLNRIRLWENARDTKALSSAVKQMIEDNGKEREYLRYKLSEAEAELAELKKMQGKIGAVEAKVADIEGADEFLKTKRAWLFNDKATEPWVQTSSDLEKRVRAIESKQMAPERKASDHDKPEDSDRRQLQ